jgi:hypothetical protein
MRPVSLAGDGRTMQNLFMGGWDGHRLELVDDSAIEPGTTKAEDVAHELSLLSDHDYAVVYVESAKLTPDVASAHGIFCESPVCLVVLDRKGGENIASWGNALAVFELNHPNGDVAGRVWIDGRAVRPPGPTTWPIYCLNVKDTPHYLHPDGAAIFPARASSSGGFALFGPTEVPLHYHQDGFLAPAPNTCDQAVADDAKKPQPEKPAFKPDQAILQAVPATTTTSGEPAPSKPRRRKKSQE